MSSSDEHENFSPLRSKPNLRMPSPRRQPLHERSNSETNTRAGPTIRIVEDPDVSTYTKTPFPSHPSHILPPRRGPAGYAFEGRGANGPRVSDSSSTTRVPSLETSNPTESLVPKPLQFRKSIRSSGSTYNSDAETVTDASPFTPASAWPSQDTSPPSSPVGRGDSSLVGLGIVQEESPPQERPTIRAVIPSNSGLPQPTRPLKSHTSNISTTSSGSSDTLILHYKAEDRDESLTALPPLPTSPIRQAKRPTHAYPSSKKRASSAQQPVPRPILKNSVESLSSSEQSSSSRDRPRSSSAPVSTPHVAFTAKRERASVVQYPVIQASQASGSRAESRILPKKLSRMSDRLTRRPWQSQLSTISSESARTSRDLSQVSELSPNPAVSPVEPALALYEEQYHEEAAASSASLPRRNPSNVRPHDWRDSDEHHDVVAELQSPQPLRQKRSGYFTRRSSDSRPSSSRGSASRPSSSQSDVSHFIANTIPAWARYYYRRGETVADLSSEVDSRRDSAHSGETDSVLGPAGLPGVYRPRTRRRADSLAISEAPREQDVYLSGQPRRGLNDPWTPRLQRDKRTVARLSAWRAPSLDEAFGVLSWSRGNRQVIMFCLGFILPPLWMLASLLPIPSPSSFDKEATSSQMEIEAAMASRLGPIDEIHYQKARWWRNLNRIMSIIGCALIATIITLSVLAARA